MRYLKTKEKYLVSKGNHTTIPRLYSPYPSDYNRSAIQAAKQTNLPLCGNSTTDTIHQIMDCTNPGHSMNTVRQQQPVWVYTYIILCYTYTYGAWGSVVVKALHYQSDGPGSIPGGVTRDFFSVVSPTEPCALGSTQPLKVSTRDFFWGKGGRCVWLTSYHPCSAETSRRSGVLTYPEPLGPPRPVAGDLYFTFRYTYTVYMYMSLTGRQNPHFSSTFRFTTSHKTSYTYIYF